ncbi:unnamed protein product [Closterium sp. Naga37s-1]|nr:unnamed protein product [Closterium sp. Naga37s-1]
MQLCALSSAAQLRAARPGEQGHAVSSKSCISFPCFLTGGAPKPLCLFATGSSLYLVTCDRKIARAGHKPGQPQGWGVKLMGGAFFFLALVTVIWAPMLIYSSGNPANYPNLVTDVRVNLVLQTCSGSFPIFEGGQERLLLDPLLNPGPATPFQVADVYSQQLQEMRFLEGSFRGVAEGGSFADREEQDDFLGVSGRFLEYPEGVAASVEDSLSLFQLTPPAESRLREALRRSATGGGGGRSRGRKGGKYSPSGGRIRDLSISSHLENPFPYLPVQSSLSSSRPASSRRSLQASSRASSQAFSRASFRASLSGPPDPCAPSLIVQWWFTRPRPVRREVASWEEVYSGLPPALLADGLLGILEGRKALGYGGNGGGALGLLLPELYPVYWKLPGFGRARELEASKVRSACCLQLQDDSSSGSSSSNGGGGGSSGGGSGNSRWWVLHSLAGAAAAAVDGAVAVGAAEEREQEWSLEVKERVPMLWSAGRSNADLQHHGALPGVLGEAMQTFSITGLYVTFVLALGRLIRSQSSDLRLKIPYENLPSCER